MREVARYTQADRNAFVVFLKEDGVVLNKQTFHTEQEAQNYADDWVSGKIQFLTE